MVRKISVIIGKVIIVKVIMFNFVSVIVATLVTVVVAGLFGHCS